MTEKGRFMLGIAICVYIIVSNYSAVAGMYTVTCLTARNMDNITKESGR
jgi:hypothetical protein